MSFAYLICTEPGRLEGEAMLLADSIRQFAGRLSEAPIISIQPRNTGELAPETQRVFSKLGVSHQRIVLNEEFHDFPLANKPIAAAYLADQGEFDTIALLDSDKAILAEPTLFELEPQHTVAVRPVHQKLFGTNGCDENADGWAAIYDHFGLRSRHRVRTTMHGDELWGYWNSGLVVARSASGIYQRWRDVLTHVLRDCEALLPHKYFAEQMSLAIALDALELDPRVLPSTYNYPIAYQKQFGAAGSPRAWGELVTVHYHKMFYQPGLRHPLAPFWDERGEQSFTWLLDALDRYGLYQNDARSLMQRRVKALRARLGV